MFRIVRWMGILGVLVVCGCWGASGPELADVSGTVTLDGKPLPGATVMFIPDSTEQTAGRVATAVTDADGEYTLEFSSARSGVQPGKYKVAIRTYVASSEDDEEDPSDVTPEKVPAVYNSKTTLTADVTSKGGSFPFELKSDAGPIVEPSAGSGTVAADDDNSC